MARQLPPSSSGSQPPNHRPGDFPASGYAPFTLGASGQTPRAISLRPTTLTESAVDAMRSGARPRILASKLRGRYPKARTAEPKHNARSPMAATIHRSGPGPVDANGLAEADGAAPVVAEGVGAAPVAAEAVGAAPVAKADGATAERVVGAPFEGAATVGEVAAVPVGLVDAGPVGVVPPPPAVAVAITGEIGEPEGVAVVMPAGVELSAYGLQLKTSLLARPAIEIDVGLSTTTHA